LQVYKLSGGQRDGRARHLRHNAGTETDHTRIAGPDPGPFEDPDPGPFKQPDPDPQRAKLRPKSSENRTLIF